MNYQEAVQYIESLPVVPEKRPDLKRIETFLSCYGSPQHAFTALHVGGTNGKGSTVAMLDAILRQNKVKVGRFTGPHLLQFNERIHIDGQPIADHEFTQRVFFLREQSERFAANNPELGKLSWFEFLTALAFFYFAEQNVDLAVIEVGMGGRYDATNVLKRACVTGITNIAFDHEHVLGNNLKDIAMEKAGIIKLGVPVITAASEPALSVLSARAAKMQSKLIVCNESDTSQINCNLEKIKADIDRYGVYQYPNALVALNMVAAAGLLDGITVDSALQGLNNFYWPGRFQILDSEQLILDVAHNPAGIKALRDSLDYLFPKGRFHFVFACYADKDGEDMLKALLKPGDRLYLAEVPGKRALFSISSLAELAEGLGIVVSTYKTIAEAIAEAKNDRGSNDFTVVTGSFATVKAAMQSFGWATVEDGLN